jgi:quercetin dioxygenase-like cupin family protein
MNGPQPSVVRADARSAATNLPANSFGEEAFRHDGAWVGYLRLPPGATSGWHHHGEWDSYACVLEGVLRWEHGPGGADAIEIAAGDTGHMPAWAVHRDVSAGDRDLVMVLFRAGHGEITIDVAGPDPAEHGNDGGSEDDGRGPGS